MFFMKFLMILLLVFPPVFATTCQVISEGYECEVPYTISVVEDSPIFISKDKFLGNFIFIAIAVGAILFAFFGTFKA